MVRIFARRAKSGIRVPLGATGSALCQCHPRSPADLCHLVATLSPQQKMCETDEFVPIWMRIVSIGLLRLEPPEKVTRCPSMPTMPPRP
jgi:hypothetical protein